MPVIFRCSSAEEFLEKAEGWLAEKEVQNNSCLIAVSNLISKPVSKRPEHYFWVIEQEGKVIGTAFWTPPYKFTVSEMDKESLVALANALRDSHANIPGVGGPKESAKHFSHLWNLKTLKSPLLEHSMRIYQLEKVTSLSVSREKFKKPKKKKRIFSRNGSESSTRKYTLSRKWTFEI